MDGVGGLKKKQAGVGSDHIYYYPKHHTAVPTSLSERLQRNKKRGPQTVCRGGSSIWNSPLIFPFFLLSPFSISFLPFGIKLPVICPSFLFSSFFFSFLYRVFLFLIRKDEYIGGFHVKMEYHICCLIHTPLRLSTPDI